MQDMHLHWHQVKVGGGVGGQQHAASGSHFKLGLYKPFEGKTVNGCLLDSWLYQMDLYFAIESSIPPEVCVSHAALLLMGNESTWFHAQGQNPMAISWD